MWWPPKVIFFPSFRFGEEGLLSLEFLIVLKSILDGEVGEFYSDSLKGETYSLITGLPRVQSSILLSAKLPIVIIWLGVFMWNEPVEALGLGVLIREVFLFLIEGS